MISHHHASSHRYLTESAKPWRVRLLRTRKEPSERKYTQKISSMLEIIAMKQADEVLHENFRLQTLNGTRIPRKSIERHDPTEIQIR